MNITRLTKMVKTNWAKSQANWKIDRNKLGPFANGYVSAALEHTADTSFFGDGKPLARKYSKHDCTDRLLAQILRDCTGFYWRNRVTLEQLYEDNWDYGEHEAGSDFFLSRNQSKEGGFFDRGFDDVWDSLQQSAVSFGPQTIYVNERGLIDIETGYRWSKQDKDWYKSGTSV